MNFAKSIESVGKAAVWRCMEFELWQKFKVREGVHGIDVVFGKRIFRADLLGESAKPGNGKPAATRLFRSALEEISPSDCWFV